MSSLTVQNIQGSASSSNTISVASGHKISGNVTHGTGSVFPTGHVIQTVTNTGTTTVNSTSTSPSDLISASITPQFTNSIIHIEGYVSRMQVVVSSNAYASLYITDPAGNNLTTAVLGSAITNSSPMSVFATHSPSSTSSQTYKIRLSKASSATSSTGTDSQRYSIKLTEIAG
tara:strand:- start:404 stop:922 length:519 start_codon:yes stop_codon:yes gene_type:complete